MMIIIIISIIIVVCYVYRRTEETISVPVNMKPGFQDVKGAAQTLKTKAPSARIHELDTSPWGRGCRGSKGSRSTAGLSRDGESENDDALRCNVDGFLN